MTTSGNQRTELPMGVVIRKQPGVTRWAKWNWTPVAVVPGASVADWAILRRDGEAVDYHAATLPLTLWASDTGAYLANLSDRVPSIYVILRNTGQDDPPLKVAAITASPFEGQDYADSGEEIVGKVAMPEGVVAWIRDFVTRHHAEQPFVKRRRDKTRVDLHEDGRGDGRIRQDSDVYRAPKRATP